MGEEEDRPACSPSCMFCCSRPAIWSSESQPDDDDGAPCETTHHVVVVRAQLRLVVVWTCAATARTARSPVRLGGGGASSGSEE